jgi:hypothetical protein
LTTKLGDRNLLLPLLEIVLDSAFGNKDQSDTINTSWELRDSLILCAPSTFLPPAAARFPPIG